MKWIMGFISLVIVCVLVSPWFFPNKITHSLITKDEAVSTESKTLVILLHAVGQNRESLMPIEDALKGKFPEGVDFFRPDLPLSYVSKASANEIVAELIARVDNIWEERKAKGDSYEKVIIVGHSMGALLARKLYVAAYGEDADAPFEPELKDNKLIGAVPLTERREWTRKNVRIVLLAGINRGWTVSHHMSLTRAAYTQIGVALSYVYEFFYGRKPIGMEVRKGAPFITQLRLQWLEMDRNSEKYSSSKTGVGAEVTARTQQEIDGNGSLEVVQLLGSVDDLVSPDDNLDLEVGRKFYYDSVPHSGHVNVIQLKSCKEGENDPDICDFNGDRRVKIVEAVSSPLHEDKRKQIYFGEYEVEENKAIKDVVFVIHGIRDEGYWTKKIGNHIKDTYEKIHKKGELKLETSSYGYFPMLSFLIPGERQRKVEWFMDRYVRARALYPNAKFHFVGHSNGTYLLAKALQDYPAVHFENVVFAGSVVKTSFQWKDYSEANKKYEKDEKKFQIGKVLNYVATYDWVVAFFPNTLERLGLQDLGGAGHDGFTDTTVKNEGYIVGAHSAALNETVWDSIAEFVVKGEYVEPKGMVRSEQNSFLVFFAYIAPVILLLIAALLVFILVGLLRLNVREWKKTLLVVSYLWLIWTVLTKA